MLQLHNAQILIAARSLFMNLNYSCCHFLTSFQVYNLVGVVRSHNDDEASMVEVEFHNTITHHSFSLPNPSGYSMAALSEQALVLATEKQDEHSRFVTDNWAAKMSKKIRGAVVWESQWVLSVWES